MTHYRLLPAAFYFLLSASFLVLTFHGSQLCANAQSASATLSGTVVDQNDAVVVGVEITVENISTALKRETTTNDEGFFTVPLLPPSTYSVTAQRAGFTPVRISDVVLNVGDQKTLKIQLKAGGVQATVEVVNETPLVDESPAVGTVVDRQFVENIPLNGRSFQSLITLTPGVVLVPDIANRTGQFSVNGQRSDANSFIVDGVSGNIGTNPGSFLGSSPGGNLPGLTAFGTTQSLVSVDALQEFRLQSSSYSAEYGRQPGGQISLVTRSGTNQFHGSLFNYLRNEVFDANDWFNNKFRIAKTPLRQNDFGGTFGGPVLLPRFGESGRQPGYDGRNRTFFFFSYEGLRLRLPKFALTNVPTLTLRRTAPAALQAILNAFPLPNGRDLGNGLAELTVGYSDPSRLNATSIRIDHTINQKLTLFARYHNAPSSSTSRGAFNLSQLQSNRIDTQTATFGATMVLTPRISNELRVNYSDNAGFVENKVDSFGGAIPPPRNALIPSQHDSSSAASAVFLFFPGRTALQPGIRISSPSSTQRQLNILDNISYSVGTHSLKFGFDYRRLTPVLARNSYDLLILFLSQAQVLNNSAGLATISSSAEARPVYLNLSAYGQDSWKVSRRLTLDIGLRWELNPAPTEANGNDPLAVLGPDNLSTMQLAPRGTRLWKTTYNNFAPRLGVAYRLSQASGREAAVRGGFGVYYDTGSNRGSLGFHGFPFSGFRSLSNVTFPLSPTQVTPPPLSSLTPPYGLFYTFDPNLKLPYTLEWNIAVEQSLARAQTVTASYVGNTGRRLLQQRQLNLSGTNPNFTLVDLTTNKATSDYNSLQLQFQRRMSRGLQALASYTWSHAIDEDSFMGVEGSVLPQRGNAAFDVRHNFAAAITYDIPSTAINPMLNAILHHWSIDTIIHAQSGLPVDLSAGQVFNPVNGTTTNVRPNLNLGVSLYIEDPNSPGGRRVNRAAFSVPAAAQTGTLGRNVVRGLPSWQVDFALRRQFNLTEELSMQLRAEAFNLFNHPNFGGIQTSLSAINFGEATNMLGRQLGGLSSLYQIGGPRSLQFALKFLF